MMIANVLFLQAIEIGPFPYTLASRRAAMPHKLLQMLFFPPNQMQAVTKAKQNETLNTNSKTDFN